MLNRSRSWYAILSGFCDVLLMMDCVHMILKWFHGAHTWSDFRVQAQQLLSLSWPMLLAKIAAVGLGVVDTMMAGGAGKDSLTAVALGSSVTTTVVVVLLGIMTPLNTFIAQLYGAGKTEEIGQIGRQGLWFGLFLGVLGMLLLWAMIVPLTHLIKLDLPVERMMGDYLFYVAWGVPACLIHRGLTAYVSSLNHTKIIMWVSIVSLLLNIPLNYVFVYGKLGMPALGGAGCGIATMLVFWFNAFLLGVYVLFHHDFQRFGLFTHWDKPQRKDLARFWHVGWPVGLSYFLEVSLFTMVVWLVADLGKDVVAAQQIVLSIGNVVYMLPASLGIAVTIRIGQVLGQRRADEARYIVGVTLVLGGVMALVVAVLLFCFRQTFVGWYTNDAAVLALATRLMLFSILFQIFDFIQCISSYALRGYNITRFPMVIHAIAFWGVGLLPGYVLTYIAGWGVDGFWWATIAALALASVLLMWYLERCSRNALLRERDF